MELFEKYLTNEKGLSSTSANYIANVGKEYIAEFESKLAKACTLYNTSMQLITSDTKVDTGFGCTANEVNDFEKILYRIADIKALTAWLREAISTKEKMIKKVNQRSFNEWVENVLHEDPNQYDRYALSATYPMAEYERSVDEQAEYLKAEAYAAVFGKFIHTKGAFHTGRNELYNIQSNPVKVEGNGQDRTIVYRTPSVDPELVDKTYMSLQSIWRSYEAQLNKYKYDTETENKRREHELTAEIARRQALYIQKTKEFEAWKQQERKYISDLKILLPAKFEETYKFLEELGKK